LKLKQGEQNLKNPFKCPLRRTSRTSDDLRRRLAARRKFVPWGKNEPFRVSLTPSPEPTGSESNSEPETEEETSVNDLPVTNENRLCLYL